MPDFSQIEEDARATFEDMAKGNKTISVGAFKEEMGALLGPALPAEVKASLQHVLSVLAALIDADGSGEIDQEEFVKASKLFVAIATSDSPFDNADLFFDLIDADGSGTASLAELQKLLCALVPSPSDHGIVREICAEIMRMGDTSGDGELSREETRAIAGKLKAMFS